MVTKRTAKKPRQTFRVWTIFQLKSDFSTSDKYLSSKWKADVETSILTIPETLTAVLHAKKLWVAAFDNKSSIFVALSVIVIVGESFFHS